MSEDFTFKDLLLPEQPFNHLEKILRLLENVHLKTDREVNLTRLDVLNEELSMILGEQV